MHNYPHKLQLFTHFVSCIFSRLPHTPKLPNKLLVTAWYIFDWWLRGGRVIVSAFQILILSRFSNEILNRESRLTKW